MTVSNETTADVANGDQYTEIQLLKAGQDRLHQDIRAMQKDMKAFIEKQTDINATTKAELNVLKAKAGAWGAIAGAVTIMAALLLQIVG